MHYCIRCGKPCDCWAFDSTFGDVCDGCSDCACENAGVGEQPIEEQAQGKTEQQRQFAEDHGLDVIEIEMPGRERRISLRKFTEGDEL